jgi:hypothetical protein
VETAPSLLILIPRVVSVAWVFRLCYPSGRTFAELLSWLVVVVVLAVVLLDTIGTNGVTNFLEDVPDKWNIIIVIIMIVAGFVAASSTGGLLALVAFSLLFSCWSTTMMLSSFWFWALRYCSCCCRTTCC